MSRCFKRGLPCVFVLLSLLFQTVYATDNNFLVDPVHAVGQITPNSTEAELIKRYGTEHVKRSEIPVGEGETIKGTLLFPKTKNELLIEWKHNFSQPLRITINQPNTQWKTHSGITLGTTLTEVEKINRQVFKLTGLGWDYEGRTTSWESGNLPNQLRLVFDYDAENLSTAEYRKISGDGAFNSNHEVFRKLKMTVRAMIIEWNN
ncbi:hypothetical protein [Zooshikella sp. RANM57]|uniref:hypothetical protein n=1 Tax=Zooshikella sp. RANM57 TaxID=3425863 RepID=UPI003D6EECC3